MLNPESERILNFHYTCMSFLNWYNFPSIVCLSTILWNVKGYLVTIECNWRSYIIFLLILPLCHL